MKTAIVHDWLTGMRGGEKCLEAFCELFPDADLYTLFHLPGRMSPAIERMRIIPSWLNRLPFRSRCYRYYLPLFPSAVRSFNLEKYDLVLSSSHCVAKGVMTQPSTLHICYCYTPMRYIWDMYHTYFAPERSSWVSRLVMASQVNRLRSWDLLTSRYPDRYVAISRYVAKRIEKYYRLPSEVIYPPVDCERFAGNFPDGGYYLIVSAFVPYKRLDLAVEAFNRLGYPLKIVGAGPDLPRIRRMARSNIEFLGWLGDEELTGVIGSCKAFLQVAEEEFGIAPLEAQAAGRPVIAFKRGGALETLIPPEGMVSRAAPTAPGLYRFEPHATAVFFYDQTVEALEEAVRYFEARPGQFSPVLLRQNAGRFSSARFKREINAYLESAREAFVPNFNKYGEQNLKQLKRLVGG